MQEKHSSYYDLKDAFATRHCSICYVARRSVTLYLDDLLYERVTDSGTVESMRSSGGFCEKHFRQLVELQDANGVAALARYALESVNRTWSQNPKDVRSKKVTKVVCPACKIWNESEQRHAELFLENLNDFPLMLAYENSFGFCIPHFKAIYSKIEDDERKNKLMAIQLKKIESLISELSDFERKHASEHYHEGFSDKNEPWIRAIEFLKGCSELLNTRERKS